MIKFILIIIVALLMCRIWWYIGYLEGIDDCRNARRPRKPGGPLKPGI